MIFVEGLPAIYENQLGTIQFVGNTYITFCIKNFPEERTRNVCILIYSKDYHKVKLLKESTK
jgi:hypothetical protein